MAEQPDRTPRPRTSQALRASDVAAVIAVVCAISVLTVVGFELYIRLTEGQTLTGGLVLGEMVRLTVGLSIAAMFLVLSWLLRALDRLTRTLDRLGALVTAAEQRTAPLSPAGAVVAASSRTALDPALGAQELLSEIRDTLLLNDEQRWARWQRMMARRREELERAVGSLLAQRRFVEAKNRVAQFEEAFGIDDRVAALHGHVDEATRQAERNDLREADEAYVVWRSNHEWEKALAHADELLKRYPASVRIGAWRDRVIRDRESVKAGQRARLVNEIREYSGKGQYRKALASARQLLEQHEHSEEAAAVRLQLETLEHNAEVELRQALERQIKELVRTKQFGEAAELAEQVIRQFPQSPQAEALRVQLPRLQERARESA